MRYNDIINIQSDYIKHLLNVGYVVNPAFMGCTISDITTYVALSDDKSTVFVYIKAPYDWDDIHMDRVTVKATKLNFGLYDRCGSVHFDTQYDELLFESTWYKVSPSYTPDFEAWFVTEDEARAACAKRVIRYKVNNTKLKTYTTDVAKKVGCSIIKKIPGFKRCSEESIECIQKMPSEGGSSRWRVICWKKCSKYGYKRKLITINQEARCGRSALGVESF